MDAQGQRRVLVVANRTAATPLLIEEVRRRAHERPTRFALLIPDAPSRKRRGLDARAAAPSGSRVPRAARSKALSAGATRSIRSSTPSRTRGFDDVIISTLPKRTSEWLRRDLPQARRAARRTRRP